MAQTLYICSCLPFSPFLLDASELFHLSNDSVYKKVPLIIRIPVGKRESATPNTTIGRQEQTRFDRNFSSSISTGIAFAFSQVEKTNTILGFIRGKRLIVDLFSITIAVVTIFGTTLIPYISEIY